MFFEIQSLIKENKYILIFQDNYKYMDKDNALFF